MNESTDPVNLFLWWQKKSVYRYSYVQKYLDNDNVFIILPLEITKMDLKLKKKSR